MERTLDDNYNRCVTNDNDKIDLYVDNEYYATTTWAKTIKEARNRLAYKLTIDLYRIKGEKS